MRPCFRKEDMDNVILIGMPSSGKSTLGVLLAKLMGYDFIDTDLLIQKRESKHLQDILDEKGAAYFKEKEAETLLSLRAEKTVIATGGSAVYNERAMAHLRSLGRVVYLFVPFSSVEERLKNLATRGVVMEKGETLRALYDKRAPLYLRYAHVVFDETEKGRERSMAENASALYALLTGEK